MKQIWSIREKMFKEDYKRRMKMFNASVALYGKKFGDGQAIEEWTE